MAETHASRIVCSKMFIVFLVRMAPAQSCVGQEEEGQDKAR